MENKAFVFDMDGVLFDTERFYMEAWREIAKEQELGDLEAAVQGCVGLNHRDTKQVFLDNYGSSFPYESYMKACARRFDEKVEAFGVPVKPGVYELLEYLKQENYRIGLASSTKREKVLSHLEKAGIRKYFHAVVGGDMVERGKPAPDIYLAACRELGAAPGDAFAAEDSPNGIRSAQGAGLKAIMVPDLIHPDMELESLLYARCRDLTEVRYLLMGLHISRVPLEGIGNTRDLAGLSLGNGRRILPNRLLRSGALHGTTDRDQKLLVEKYGLKTVVDFRTGAERQDKPDPELPGVRNIWNPIMEEAALGITREEGARKNNAIKEVVEMTASQENGAEKYMQAMYVNLIQDSYSRKQYRKFFDILLEQEEGAVLWHCSAGKDRVGVATALLLSALGAGRDIILADYMKTNQFGRAEAAGILEQILGHGPSFRLEEKEALNGLRFLFIVEAGFLEAVFEQAEKEWGSMEAFLEQEMGLTAKKRQKLQAMYTV